MASCLGYNDLNTDHLKIHELIWERSFSKNISTFYSVPRRNVSEVFQHEVYR